MILLALAGVAACGAAMSVQAQTEDVSAQSDATWKTHTAFDGQISKIIEGNRYVYVFAHQAFYHDDTDYKLFKTPRGTVLYIDKQNPGKGVHGLFDTYRPTGNDVRVLNYNPRTGTLWICYSDGGIDVLEDSGTMHSIKALRNPSMAKMGQTGTVSFDLNDDAWIAMDRGYVRIDGATYEVKECVYVDSPVESICLVGDKVVAIVGDAFYDAPESGDRTRMESFRKHTELSVTSANCILPVSATSFEAECRDLEKRQHDRRDQGDGRDILQPAVYQHGKYMGKQHHAVPEAYRGQPVRKQFHPGQERLSGFLIDHGLFRAHGVGDRAVVGKL